MRTVSVIESITLDGVMQAPGSVDEDTRNGFGHGGWAAPYADEVMVAEMSKGFGTGDLLFGRRTYERFYSYWPAQDSPFTDVLNQTTKYVASRTDCDLPWENSVLLRGDGAELVAELKQAPGADIGVLGSGELVRDLIRADLVDEYVLLIHPLTLGTGDRLFGDDGGFATLRLTDSVLTTTGVIIARYERTTR